MGWGSSTGTCLMGPVVFLQSKINVHRFILHVYRVDNKNVFYYTTNTVTYGRVKLLNDNFKMKQFLLRSAISIGQIIGFKQIAFSNRLKNKNSRGPPPPQLWISDFKNRRSRGFPCRGASCRRFSITIQIFHVHDRTNE